MKRFRGRQRDILKEPARADILAIADDAIARWRVRVPPPGETVFEMEANEIRRAALAFLEMERRLLAGGDGGEWWELEYAFGQDGRAGRYDLGDGRTLELRGRADRIDRLPDGTLRVVDYKTGRSSYHQKSSKKPPFDGGRQLQAALYAQVLQALLDKKVSRFEYRFPTERGESEIVAYDEAELRSALGVIRQLLDQLDSGAFIPTTDHTDCRHCDSAAICRVHQRGHDTTSPRAKWAQDNAPNLEEYLIMRSLRAVAGKGDDA